MTHPSILNVFGRSPIRPLQAHMSKIAACTQQLIPFFQAVVNADWSKAQSQQLAIARIENEADVIKRELRVHLPNSLFLPVSRSDLLSMLTVQDKIADKARDIAGLVLGRKLQFPADISSTFITFLQRNLDAVNQAEKVVNELDELLETGFIDKEVGAVEKLIQTLDEIESDTDQMQIAVRQKIYAIENTLSPIDAIFLYKVAELTGQLADGAQHVGDNLQLLLAR